MAIYRMRLIRLQNYLLIKLEKKNVVVTDLGPALGAHGGPGAMAIAIQPF